MFASLLWILACTGKGDDTGADPTAGIELRGVDAELLADQGLEVWTYAVTAGHSSGLRDNTGGDPLFYVVRPPGAGLYPGVLWLHGGVGATDDDPEYASLCTPEGIEEIAVTGVLTRKVLMGRLAQQHRILVVPISTWCDLWAGLGPEDPVDPNHRSMLHVRVVMDAMEAGLDGVRLDTRDYGIWGMSIGGLGAFPVGDDLLARGMGPRAVVSDSGPVRMLEMYTEDGGMPLAWLDHFFGGPPTDEAGAPTAWWDNYARVDGPERIWSLGYRLPLLNVWNQQDGITAAFHGERLAQALDEVYAPAGVRHTSLDLDHRAPDAQYHTQSAETAAPLTYLVDASLRFLQGQDLRYVEAEDLCELGCTATDSAGEADEGVRAALVYAAGEDALVRRAEDGAGVLFEAALPADLPWDNGLSVAFATTSAGVEGTGEDPLLYVELLDGDTVLVSQAVSEIALNSEIQSTDLKLVRMNATTLPLSAATLAEAAAPRLRVTTTGAGQILLDGLYFAWRAGED